METEKWEYKDINFGTSNYHLALLNQFGDEGWELVQIDHQREYAIFKRPKAEKLTEVTGDMPHRCHQMIEAPGSESQLNYYRFPRCPENNYYYLSDPAYPIAFCPWCGDDI